MAKRQPPALPPSPAVCECGHHYIVHAVHGCEVGWGDRERWVMKCLCLRARAQVEGDYLRAMK